MKQSWVLCPSAITRHEQKYGRYGTDKFPFVLPKVQA